MELTNKGQKLRQYKPNIVCIFLILLTILLNVPFFFVFEPQKIIILVDQSSNTTEYLFHISESKFALSFIGKIIKNIHYFIRDILTLIVLIMLNLAVLVSFRRIKNKNHNTIITSTLRQTNSVLMLPSSSTYSFDRNGRTKMFPISALMLGNRPIKNTIYFNVNKANRKLTKMVFIICAISCLEHTSVVLALYLFPKYLTSIRFGIIFIANVLILIKNSINFFVYYNYNNFYRIRLKRMLYIIFKRSKSKQSNYINNNNSDQL